LDDVLLIQQDLFLEEDEKGVKGTALLASSSHLFESDLGSRQAY
jgi:hypothetical protein